MSKKQQKDLYFIYPIYSTVTKNGRKERELTSTLEIIGTAYCYPNVPKTDIDERYDFDIDFILKDGTNIKPELEEFDAMDKINVETLRHVSRQFNGGEYIEFEEVANDGEVGRTEPAVTGCNDRVGVLKIFEPLNKILSTFKTN